MFRSYVFLPLVGLVAVVNSQENACQNLWIEYPGNQGTPPELYVYDTNTYTTASPYQTLPAGATTFPPNYPSPTPIIPIIPIIPLPLESPAVNNTPTSTGPVIPWESITITPTKDGWWS